MSVNRVTLIGRLGEDPTSRAFPNGGSICNLRLATTESWKDKQSGERQERTEWHRVVLRNKLGQIAQQYLRTGSQVYIEGSIRTRKWQDQNGQDKYSTEIMGSQMTMLGGGQNTGSNQPNSGSSAEQKPAPAKPAPDYGPVSDFEDDIPF